jgi:hypothetical protein
MTIEETPEPMPIVETKTATTATQARAPELDPPPPKTAVTVPYRKAAAGARSKLLAKRKQLGANQRALESRISQLEARLKVTGPRNDQRDVLADLGRSRGELAKLRSIRERCERAFGSEEWGELDEAWVLAEDLAAEGEGDAAEENYRRFVELARSFREHCEALEPIKGAR